jgi:4-hydroxy-4-methyl-2-oxoglutarate aldolase
MSPDLVERLRGLDACAVSDALERHGLPPAVVGLVQIGAPMAIAGRAVTVELGPATGTSPARHLCTAAVDACGVGDVIVVANQGRTDCAAWGGLLSQAASLRKLEGVVIDGACRDVPEALEVELPVYARGPIAVTARGRVVERSWGETVQVVGTTVGHGDLVIADASGVAFVPQAVAEQVIQTAEEIAAREASMAAALRTGMPVSEVMGADYESLLSRLGRDE